MTNSTNNLIFDIGVGSGVDTYFYLSKKFKVVGVEADPVQYKILQKMFVTNINNGTLILINAAASDSNNQHVTLYHDMIRQGCSTIIKELTNLDHASVHTIPTINYFELSSKYGVPYYCKIDIEGSDLPFLKSFTQNNLPNYISAEIFTIDVIDQLYNSGYNRFQLVSESYNQILYYLYMHTNTFENEQTEGVPFTTNFPLKFTKAGMIEWSGLFGKELSARWFDYAEIKKMYLLAQRFYQKFPAEFTGARNVFDCHATKK